MRITRRHLRRLIAESVFQFPSARRIDDMLRQTYNEMISLFDEGDPSMENLGMAAWVHQIDNAIEFIRDEVDGDMSMYNMIENEAFDMLIDGRFHPDNSLFMMRMR